MKKLAKKDNIVRFVDIKGNIYRVNYDKGTYKRVNSPKWVFLSKEEFDALETKKIGTDKYNNLLNTYFKKLKIEWEFNGDKYRALAPIESNEWGNISNYVLHNFKHKINKDVDIPIIPYFNIDRWYGYGFIAMFRGVVGYVVPYQNGGYQFLNIKTKDFKQWVTLKNLRPIMNMTTKQIIGDRF